MLEAVPSKAPGEPRLRVTIAGAEAWITRKPWRHSGADWELWVARGGILSCRKCQARLEIESRLRAWTLRWFRRPLATMSFAELLAAAEDVATRRKDGPPGRRPPVPDVRHPSPSW